MDAIDGLKALEQVVETIGEELDDLYQRRDIPQIERVTLQTLEWTLAKLADDLHTMETEVRNLRLAEAKALDDLDHARAELSGNSGQLPAEPAREPYPWAEGDELIRNGEVRSVEVASRGYVKLYGLYSCPAQIDWERTGWKLYRKASDVPPAPAPEPYRWQVGDEIRSNDKECRKVVALTRGLVKLAGFGQLLTQPQWERTGWKLYRKASDLGVQQLTPRQVEISDSGTDGEGKS